MPATAPFLEEALYRDAETRRQRQLEREEAASAHARVQRTPRLGRTSRALCQGRVERELREAFGRCLACRDASAMAVGGIEYSAIPREKLPDVLRALGLLCGAEGEEQFCSKLALLLDSDNRGTIAFGRLLGFLLRSIDRDDEGRDGALGPPGLAPSLEEECFRHLERQLSRAFGRLLSNRLSRPKTPPPATSRSPSPGAAAEADAAPAEVRRPRSAPHGGRRSASACVAAPAADRAAGRPDATATPGHRPQISRCHLLYHQAIFALRESVQLEEEIKELKQREEMRECTFRPRLCTTPRSARRSLSASGPQPRNFEAAVSRMRLAHRQRLEKREEEERIPCGENYERHRRLTVKPFDLGPHKERCPAIVYVDVTVSKGRVGRIGLHEGDDLGRLSRSFAKAFQLDRAASLRLEEMLQEAYAARVQELGLAPGPGAAVPAPPRRKGIACRPPAAPPESAGGDASASGSPAPWELATPASED